MTRREWTIAEAFLLTYNYGAGWYKANVSTNGRHATNINRAGQAARQPREM